LEDYAVELRDSDGHAFDCLHFQQVSVVLKNDEEVLLVHPTRMPSDSCHNLLTSCVQQHSAPGYW
jgi:hypothetical protein